MRVQSAEALLTRVFGRPTERVEVGDTTELRRLTNLSEEELRRLQAELEADGVVVPFALPDDNGSPASSPGP